MKNSIKLTLVVLIALQGTFLYPGGKHVASYTRMKVDARALAMGGAFTSACDGIESMFYNPSGLMYSEGIELGTMFSSGMAFDRSYNFAGVSTLLNTELKQAIGVAGMSAKLDGIPRYANSSSLNPSGEFSVDETSVMFSYASYDKRVDSYWGATLKLFNSSVDNDSKTGVGVDFGVMTEPLDNMKLGIMVKDIYSKVGSEQISPSVNMGLTVRSLNDGKKSIDTGILASFEAGYIFDGESGVQYAAGLEYYLNYNDNIAFIPRAGLNNDSITAGFGLVLNLFQIDYAYIPKQNDNFNDSQRISLILKF